MLNYHLPSAFPKMTTLCHIQLSVKVSNWLAVQQPADQTSVLTSNTKVAYRDFRDIFVFVCITHLPT